ncbi:hypothetical protein GINT2_002358 [Glugoides intestinalis]
MLIESIARYKVDTKKSPLPICSLKFSPTSLPLPANDYLVCSGNKVYILNHKLLSFTVCNSIPCSKLFVIDSPEAEDILAFDSIYQCTNITASSKEGCIYFEFDLMITIDEVLSDLRRMFESIKLDNGILTTGDVPFAENTFSRYKIKAADGELIVNSSLLKRRNVTGIYFNNNSVSTRLHMKKQETANQVNKKTLNITESTHKSIKTHRTVQEENIIRAIGQLNISDESLIQQLNHYRLANIKQIEEKLASAQMKKDSECFEYTNSDCYGIIAKEFLKEFEMNKYNFIRHSLIQSTETFYFTVFKVDCLVTVFVTRKFYNYTSLYNYLDNIEDIKSLLKIPDLNKNSEEGTIFIKYPEEIMPQFIDWKLYNPVILLNQKYNLPYFDCTEQLNLIFNYSSVMLEENEYSFIFLMKLKEILYPLRFPGLIISPLIESMKYLLSGPYSFIISSRSPVSVIDRLIFTCSTPVPTEKKPVPDKKRKKTTIAEKLLQNKEKYIFNLLQAKKSLQAVFEAPKLIEKYFLNEPTRFKVDYIYDLQKREVVFLKGAYLNLGDALNLWMLIYPEQIDLEQLSRKRCVNSEFLCRRACIDNNFDLISRLITGLEENKPIKVKRQQGMSSIARRIIKGQHRSLMRKSSQVDILRTIGSSYNIFKVKINFGEEIKVIRSRKRFTEMVDYKGKRHRLLRVDDIIGCLESGYSDEQVEASILANIKWFDLAMETDKASHVGMSSEKKLVMYI